MLSSSHAARSGLPSSARWVSTAAAGTWIDRPRCSRPSSTHSAGSQSCSPSTAPVARARWSSSSDAAAAWADHALVHRIDCRREGASVARGVLLGELSDARGAAQDAAARSGAARDGLSDCSQPHRPATRRHRRRRAASCRHPARRRDGRPKALLPQPPRIATTSGALDRFPQRIAEMLLLA